MNKEKVMEIAMQIVAYSGSAFDFFNKAIEAAEEDDMHKAEECMAEGREELRHAHDAQTDLLAAEAGDEEIPFSILMVHAQDHLTMAIFAERMAKHFIVIAQKGRRN